MAALFRVDLFWRCAPYSHAPGQSQDYVRMTPCLGETAYPGSQGSLTSDPRRDQIRDGSPIPQIPIFQSGPIHRAIPSRRERRTRRFKRNRSYTRPTRLSRSIHTDHPRSGSLAGARTPVSRDGEQQVHSSTESTRGWPLPRSVETREVPPA